MSLRCFLSSFSSIQLMVWKEMSFEDFQDGCHGGHLGKPNGTILAILNLYVALVLPIKFQLNPTYSLGGDVVWRISRWPPWWPSWIWEWNDFSNSESLCHSDASHQVSTHSDLRFGRRCVLKNFKMIVMVAIFDIEMEPLSNSESLCPSNASHRFGSIWHMVWEEMSFEGISRQSPWRPSWISEWIDFSNSESLCHSDASYPVSAQSDLRFGRCHLKNFKMAARHGGHLGYRNTTILAILNLYVTPMPLIKFRLNLTYDLGGDVVWRISRWPPWWPSWISERNHFSDSGSPCCHNASH